MIEPELERMVQLVVASPYPLRVWREPEGYYVVDSPDVNGVLGTGDDEALAIADWRAAFAAWAEARLISGETIPEPTRPVAEGSYSGRLLLRLPRSLHRDLSEAAEREGISINQVAIALIAAGVGRGDVGIAADAIRALDTTGFEPGTPDYDVRRVMRDLLRAQARGRAWDAAKDGSEESPNAQVAVLRLFGTVRALPEAERKQIVEFLVGLFGVAEQRPTEARTN
jgi:predicted RNase H-like HicB family nuclease